MKKITLLAVCCLVLNIVASAQSNGRGNGGQNNNGNNGNGYGNNGNGNGQGNNGNGNGNGGSNNNSGSSNGGGSSSAGGGEASAATQSTNLSLANAIEITFAGNMSATGADVTIPFTTVNDYANGVESDAQELKVRSNKNFSVAVKANASEFSYTGNTTPAPEMPVEGVLAVKVTANGTGGSIAGSFSEYATLTSSNQDLITAADRGGNQTFSVKYKATPGFAYPAGTYAVDVVYTATQE
jgi:hypothetical protein